jgi:hypothetical protein
MLSLQTLRRVIAGQFRKTCAHFVDTTSRFNRKSGFSDAGMRDFSTLP